MATLGTETWYFKDSLADSEVLKWAVDEVLFLF